MFRCNSFAWNGVTGIGVLLLCFYLHLCDANRNRVRPASLTVRPPPMINDEIDPKCWNFTHGNWKKMEFYSPNYPNNYHNNSDCVQYLEAPPGFKIQLDFRDQFVLEKSDDCKYDYLEVRDGPFAYSDVIGRYCDIAFPELIESSSRFLWLRFKTDDLLQYGGFRAVYSYVKDTSAQKDGGLNGASPSTCRSYIEVNNQNRDGVLSSDDIPFWDTDAPGYPKHKPVDCTWEIHTMDGFGISINSLDLEVPSPERCDENFVALYKGSTRQIDRFKKHCSSSQIEMKSIKNRIFIRIYGRRLSLKPKLKLVYSIFRITKTDLKNAANAAAGYDDSSKFAQKPCLSSEFSCDDLCLSKKLICNGVPNCRSGKDERGCQNAKVDSKEDDSELPLHVIVLGAVGGVIFTISVIVICVTCIQRRRQKRNENEALKQKKLQQRNALEMAVSNSSNTTLCLSKHGSGQGSPNPNQYTNYPRTTVLSKDNPHRYSLGSSVQHSSEGDPNDQMSESGNYKRFLMLDVTPDEESSPCPSVYSQGERHPMQDQMRFSGPNYTGGNNWRSVPEECVMGYPYNSSLTRPNPILTPMSKPFTYSPDNKYLKQGMHPDNKYNKSPYPDNKFMKPLSPSDNKYIKSFKTMDGDIIVENPTA
ncbi:hypothetical protein SNE40_017889 [Patella caerulea]|uniref:CUB domain-containing protein n=1 Tax=Patella caerulea TaxID=87958 RepID=A0AAN8JJ35_PATCE